MIAKYRCDSAYARVCGEDDTELHEGHCAKQLAAGRGGAWNEIYSCAPAEQHGERVETLKRRCIIGEKSVERTKASLLPLKWRDTMTRSKIQKMKFFIFLLIFLLAQIAVCDGNFREKRDTPLTVGGNKTTSLENKSIDVKNDKQPSTAPLSAHRDGQQNSIRLNANKPPADGNKTHDDITRKSSDVANRTTHIANTSNEVCVLRYYNVYCYIVDDILHFYNALISICTTNHQVSFKKMLKHAFLYNCIIIWLFNWKLNRFMKSKSDVTNRVSPNILVNVYVLDIFDALYYIYLYIWCLVAYIVYEIHIIIIDYDTFWRSSLVRAIQLSTLVLSYVVS